MSEAASLLMLQFLTWIAERPRSREQTVEGWHSCPHISVWEDAVVASLVRTENNGKRTIVLTPRGRALTAESKAVSTPSAAAAAVSNAARQSPHKLKLQASGRPGRGGMSKTLSTRPIMP